MTDSKSDVSTGPAKSPLASVQFAKAVNGVSFSLCEGETLGILGESACGKSVTPWIPEAVEDER